jgi:hypothetical protein
MTVMGRQVFLHFPLVVFTRAVRDGRDRRYRPAEERDDRDRPRGTAVAATAEPQVRAVYSK